MRSKRILSTLLGCGLALASCEDSTEVTPPGGSTIPLEDIPQKAAEALCEAWAECLGDFMDLTLGGEDCQQLIEKGFANGSFENMTEAVDGGTANYHGDKAQACLDALAALGCDALVSNSPPECDAAFEGTVAEGGDCTYSVECVDDLFCEVDGGCPGTCVARGAIGADCDEDDECQTGLLCLGDTSTCATPAGQSAPCGEAAEAECAPGLFCIGEDEQQGTPGACSSPAQVFVGQEGDSCDIAEGPWCEQGAHCAVTSFTAPDTFVTECVATAASGAACSIAVPAMCPSGEYCDVPLQSFEGTCEPLPEDGEACTGGFSARCALYHRCIDDVCVALEENGGSCTDDGACYSGHCNSSSCGPYDPC